MKFISTKTYSHSIGLSCCFRQWRATHSHCKFLHGYSIQVGFEFIREDEGLDSRNWVMDFGGLKFVKKYLEENFDHKTLVAYDDPQLSTFEDLHKLGVIDLIKVQAVGCEMFAKIIYEYVCDKLPVGIKLLSCEVREHESNSAKYTR